MPTRLLPSRWLAASLLSWGAAASGQVTLYEEPAFGGRAFTATHAVRDFSRTGFDDRTSSAVVESARWELCEHVRYGGRCVVLRRGGYDSLAAIGIDNVISSARPAEPGKRYSNERAAQMPLANYDYRRRANERVYEAMVVNVRAVMRSASRHCWVERQLVPDSWREARTAGRILAHQHADKGGSSSGVMQRRDIRRCEAAPGGPPAYWDVTYSYMGREHYLQMTGAPGPVIAVNVNGVPRQ